MSELTELSRWLGTAAGAAATGITKGVAKGGLLLEAQIKAGAPVATGFYRASWNTQPLSPTSVVVSTSAPYGRRLEHGFHGADRLGRVYSQAARPHVEPAIAATQTKIEEAIADSVAEALR